MTQKGAGQTQKALENLSESIRFRTISCEDPSEEDKAQFEAFRGFLKKAYPLVHVHLKTEIVGDQSLLYEWKGSNENALPLLLAAHMDVVPVELETLKQWTHPPFEGVISDGYIWGRGTMDCKGLLISILEAVEALLVDGFKPTRTVLLAFGQDEEVGGLRGAEKIAELLKSRGVTPELVIDEGGAIADLGIPGFKKLIAGVGIAEKGYLTIELVARARGGHASVPPRHTAIGLLSRAITRLEKHPFPSKVGEIPALTLERLMPELPLYLRLALSSRLITSLIMRAASRYLPPLGAMLRTTTAVTMVSGGTKDNVLPQEARATVNLRLLPGETCEDALKRVKKVVRDKRVEVHISGMAENPTDISSVKTSGFETLERTIKECFPEVVIVPYLVVGMTDSRHYSRLSDSVFRFSPVRGSRKELELAHGTNERLSVENFAEFIEFFKRLIKNSSASIRS